MKVTELYKEIRATTIILCVVGLMISLTYIINNHSFRSVLILAFVFYILLLTLCKVIAPFARNKLLDKFINLLAYPVASTLAIFTLLIPFCILFFNILIYFAVAFLIPELAFTVLTYFKLIDFVTVATTVYLKITLTVTFSVILNPLLRNIVNRISPARIKSSEKLKPYEINKLTDYLLSSNNLKFFVYAFYLISLFITNIANFQGYNINNDNEADKSILQSFVTFIAFDKTLSLMNQLEFKPSILLAKIKKSISNKFNNYSNER